MGEIVSVYNAFNNMLWKLNNLVTGPDTTPEWSLSGFNCCYSKIKINMGNRTPCDWYSKFLLLYFTIITL